MKKNVILAIALAATSHAALAEQIPALNAITKIELGGQTIELVETSEFNEAGEKQVCKQFIKSYVADDQGRADSFELGKNCRPVND